jgi:uncharacterized protein with ParB-like and HNH nuclease domain
MEAKTTIRNIFAGNRIIVPTYQRAYSWDTPKKEKYGKTQTDIFITDLEEYNDSNTKSPYYFGHFLFEEKENSEFNVIDGQQRLTTIVIYLSALFSRLQYLRDLTEEEEVCYEDIIKRRSTIRFSTVDYDNLLFKDYVVIQQKTNTNNIETISSKRIIEAFDYFKESLKGKNEQYLTKMLTTISNATCTTHPVQDEAEAIQMFIFQNNRGKKPSNLEVLKAQFMYTVHLHGNDETNELIKDIKDRFEKIYKSIASIENNINEDDILVYTQRVYFNSLGESNALAKINKELYSGNPISFVKDFTYALADSFEYLKIFFAKDEKDNINIHSLITLGGFAIAIPFIIKAYKFGLSTVQIGELCQSLESLVLRHRLIGTSADMITRINGPFKEFSKDNKSVNPIQNRIDWMKTRPDYWWGHWNNEKLENALQGNLHHPIAKFILWKYENSLESNGKSGYVLKRYDSVISPELEHIAPSTKPEQKPHGYDTYDENFRNEYLNCLGNFLLLSKSHNCAVGNVIFSEKHKTYIHSEQQREVQSLVAEDEIWSKEVIKKRKERIIEFVMDTF